VQPAQLYTKLSVSFGKLIGLFRFPFTHLETKDSGASLTEQW
jgi:hypothetical protein